MLKNPLWFITLLLLAGLLGGVNVYAFESQAVNYEKAVVNIESESVEVNIITVDLAASDIDVEVVSAAESGRTPVPFSEIVESRSTVAAINADGVSPGGNETAGNLMIDGEMVSASAGSVSVGITYDKDLLFGEPMIFTKLYTTDNESNKSLSWTVNDINSGSQSGEQSVIYTPAKGSDVYIQNAGCVMIVEDGVISNFYKVESGRTVNVPGNGYVVYFSDDAAQTTYFFTPEIGRRLDYSHVSFSTGRDDFQVEDVNYMVSAGPRLVRDGYEDNYSADISFNEAGGKSERMALGELSDGKMVLVQTPEASIDELAQIMISLGCVNAVYLDGGGHSSVYVNGEYISNPSGDVSTAIVITKIGN